MGRERVVEFYVMPTSMYISITLRMTLNRPRWDSILIEKFTFSGLSLKIIARDEKEEFSMFSNIFEVK